LETSAENLYKVKRDSMTEFDSQFLKPWIQERSKAFIEELNKENG